MPIDQSLVGSTAPPQHYTVTADAIVRFARATGADIPAYLAGEIAPPTFPTIFRGPKPPGLDDVAPQRFVHGEQEFTYVRPLVAGDQVTCTTRITEVIERTTRLGPSHFITLETTGVDAGGQPVFRGRMLVIVR